MDGDSGDDGRDEWNEKNMKKNDQDEDDDDDATTTTSITTSTTTTTTTTMTTTITSLTSFNNNKACVQSGGSSCKLSANESQNALCITSFIWPSKLIQQQNNICKDYKKIQYLSPKTLNLN